MRAAWLAVVAAACNAHGEPKFRAAGGAPHVGGTLHIALSRKVISLDPLIGGGDEQASNVVHPLFDTLVDFKPESLDIEPRLARSFEPSPDGLVYTFHLRDGITYEDGRPIVAGDFKYALERTLAMHESAAGGDLVDVVGADEVVAGKTTDCAGITTPDDRTLVIRLAQRNAAFIYIMALSFTAPERRDWVEAVGADIRRRPLASGPYRLESWDEGQRIVLARNPNYYDDSRGRIERIEILEDVERDTQFLMFERGELDTVEHVDTPDLLWISNAPGWKDCIHRRVLMNAYGSRMNVRVPPFDDVRVRQALNYALNKSHTTKILAGTSVPSHGILPPGMLGFDDQLQPYELNIDKAKKLLSETRYPNGFETDYVTTNEDDARRVAESLQSDLAAIGVRVNIVPMDVYALETLVGTPSGPAFSFRGWTADYPDPINFIDLQFGSRHIADKDSGNTSFYSNPALDQLLDRARGERSRKAREALYKQAEAIVYEDAPWIWNYHQQMVEVVQPYVQGYEPHPEWQRDYTHAWLDLGPDGEPVPR